MVQINNYIMMVYKRCIFNGLDWLLRAFVVQFLSRAMLVQVDQRSNNMLFARVGPDYLHENCTVYAQVH